MDKYVEIKCQLDATEVFIADLIACSTCFGHHYAHHQELKRVLYSGCCLWYFVLWFSSCCSGVELRVMCLASGCWSGVELRVMCVASGCWSGVELRVMCLASGYWSGVELRVMCPASGCRTHNPQLHTRPAT